MLQGHTESNAAHSYVLYMPYSSLIFQFPSMVVAVAAFSSSYSSKAALENVSIYGRLSSLSFYEFEKLILLVLPASLCLPHSATYVRISKLNIYEAIVYHSF